MTETLSLQTDNILVSNEDPVFSAIINHKIARCEEAAAVATQDILEVGLPTELRQSDINAGQRNIVKTDDQRWIACQKKVMRTCDATDSAAWAILTNPPTTPQGVSALMTYVNEFEEQGDIWTDGFIANLHTILAATNPAELSALVKPKPSNNALDHNHRLSRTTPSLQRASEAIQSIFPEGVPSQADEPNAILFRKVADHLKFATKIGVGNDTILRAAGRRRN